MRRSDLLPCVLVAVSVAAGWDVPTAAASENCTLQRVAALELATEGAGVPVLDVTMDGRKRRLVVDTGAFWSHIFRGTVRELNLAAIQARNIASVSVTGHQSSEYVRVPNLMLGDASAGDREFIVDAGSNPNAVIGETGIAGLLGAEILKQFDVDFDFGKNRLNLFTPNQCRGKVFYWRPSTVAVVPFRMDDGYHITFPVKVDGTQMTAMLDTGFSFTTINRTVAERVLDFDEDAPYVQKVGRLDGKADIFQTRIKSIDFEGVIVSNPTVNVLPDLAAQATRHMHAGSLIAQSEVSLPSFILGMSTLQKMHVYIAYKERKLYLSEAGEANAPGAP